MTSFATMTRIPGTLLVALLFVAPVRAQDDQEQSDFQRLDALRRNLQRLHDRKHNLEEGIKALDQKLADTDAKIAQLEEEIAHAQPPEPGDDTWQDPGYSNSGFANPVGKVPQRDTTSEARSRLKELAKSRDATNAAIADKKARLETVNRDITKEQNSIRDLEAQFADRQKRKEKEERARSDAADLRREIMGEEANPGATSVGRPASSTPPVRGLDVMGVNARALFDGLVNGIEDAIEDKLDSRGVPPPPPKKKEE